MISLYINVKELKVMNLKIIIEIFFLEKLYICSLKVYSIFSVGITNNYNCTYCTLSKNWLIVTCFQTSKLNIHKFPKIGTPIFNW